ncbi:MAG: DUF5131 family protein [Bosea sp.]|uniref:DUF5131 family protein n=1 Tax=unclassified Bosea (in: a-proteobacteria) TaxID=2653178 RepID=UPI0009618A7A|nr:MULTISPECIES: DUF5131 family protein [unclassified Bosea (in: a-proteobacteria)]MBN9459011.1 DUF5131 family protein [Bosea sp. (in: a-proteobacteria)]OJV06246.1 MAG: hypothetical protein BGO20_08290 [Bosea sp. 67-29]
MGENSAIEWCDHTFNPWEGCQKVGPGCDHCYAETRNRRFAGVANWGPHAPRRRTSASNWAQPRIWNRKAQAFRAKHGHWPRVFCASLADVFDSAVDPTWRRQLWELIRDTPDLRWILLTKRVGNIAGKLPFGWLDGAFDHVGLMITVVDQDEADRDIPKLLNVPIAGRQWFGVSHEPALGAIRWSGVSSDGKRMWNWLTGESGTMYPDGPDFDHGPRLSWIIYGGESGADARPSHPDWARADRDLCAETGTAFMLKQWGEYGPCELHPPGTAECSVVTSTGRHLVGQDAVWGDPSDERAEIIARFGKTKAGRLLDGREHLEFPEALS